MNISGESLFVILAVGIAAGWLAGQMNGGPGSHPVLGPLPRAFPFSCYLADLIGSSMDILRTFPHLEHSKNRRLGPSQFAPTWTRIMRLWQAGQSGRGIGISVGSGRA